MKAQMREVRKCPECGAEKGVACRKPSCPQLKPICNMSEDGKHHYVFEGTNGSHVEYYVCTDCGETMKHAHYDNVTW